MGLYTLLAPPQIRNNRCSGGCFESLFVNEFTHFPLFYFIHTSIYFVYVIKITPHTFFWVLSNDDSKKFVKSSVVEVGWMKKSKTFKVKRRQAIGVIIGVILSVIAFFPIGYVFYVVKRGSLTKTEFAFEICNNKAIPSGAFMLVSGFICISVSTIFPTTRKVDVKIKST